MPDSSVKETISAELVRHANEGDDRAMSELIIRISPAAVAKSVKFSRGNPRISKEDLAQEGMVGFLYAVRMFDPSKGVPFEAYASTCIESRIKSFLRNCSSAGNLALTYALDMSEESEGLVTDPEDSIRMREEKIEITRFIETRLTDFERKVLDMRMEGYKYSDIAAALCCSKKAVDNAVQRIRKKYREFREQSA